jgi:archaemetzincin
MNRILMVSIGSVDSDIMRNIAGVVEKVFRCMVSSGKEMPVPQDSYNPRRKQYLSTTILKEMQAAKPKGFDRMLGITDVALYVPDLNFVFGQADLSSGVAIISMTRLRQEFYGFKPDRRLLQERAVKEAIHEIGHTYGLGHCNNPKCIMYFSNSLNDTDIKGPGFCNICRKQLGL